MAKGSDLFMQSLVSEGVRYIFGNPGTTESPLMDILADYSEIQYLLALHEGIAVGIADAYALASGNVGVVNLHAAPGLGNGVGMLFNAWVGRSPLVVTAGQPDNRLLLREPLLSHNLVAMAAPLTKWSVQVERADELPLVMHRAFKVAQEPPSGPVFVSLPMNVMMEESKAPVLSSSQLFLRPHAGPEALEQAASLLLKAQNPVIICGDGIFRSAAQAELVRLAELTGAPVWNTLLTAAVNFPMTHPQLRGELPDNQQGIREQLGEPDVVLLVGGHFFREVFYTPQMPWPRDAAVIHIDAAPSAVARNYAVTVGIVGDVKLALQELGASIDTGASEEFLAASAARRREHQQWKAELERQQQERLQETWDERPMTSARFMVELRPALPENVVVVGEVNTCRDDLLQRIPFEHPGDYYGSRGGGIGQGLPGALGYHLAHPDRPLLALSGDGSALYSVPALWTAAHYHMPIVFIILNNRAYRIVKQNMDRYREYFDIEGTPGYPFLDLTDPDIDYVKLAEGFGVPARRVSDPEQVGDAVREAFGQGGPYLIDVPIETDCGELVHE